MRFQNDFELPTTPDRAWPLVLDIEQTAPCLPGARVVEVHDDTSYEIELAVALGPMRLKYAGQLTVLEANEESRTVVIAASTEEVRGGGGAQATVTTRLLPAGTDRARVDVETDLHITGRAAQMGRSIIEDVASRLTDDFARCTAARLSPGEHSNGGEAVASRQEASGQLKARPIRGLRLLLSVLWMRLRRAVGRPSGGRPE